MKMSVCGLLMAMAMVWVASCGDGNAAAQSAAAVSELKTAAVFSDNMVLQQGQPIRVWGRASDGATVTVDLNGQKASATVVGGKWLVSLKPMALGGPFAMTITAGDKKIEYKNVIVGDVWVCSGQSNMEWPVAATNNAQAEMAAAKLPEIRFFTVEKATSRTPLEDVKGTWVVCSPETVGGFSAVGFYFGRELNKAGIKNIGLINTSWGGTPAEAWTTLETLKGDAEYAPIMQRDTNPDDIRAKLEAKYGKLVTAESDRGKLYNDTRMLKEGWAGADVDAAKWETMDLPKNWEQAGLDIDGIVWFRKQIDLPEAWVGKDLTLEMTPIDDYDITFFNGQKVGGMGLDSGSPWQTPRVYNVPGSLVKAGKNVIAIRVFDTGGGGGITSTNDPFRIRPKGGPAEQAKDLKGAWQYRIEGISAIASGGEQNNPARLYNAMIDPIVKAPIKGAIWYQGESNAGRAYQYRKLFRDMITDWRKAWKVGDFSFYFVQLANFMDEQPQPVDSAWAELREAQTMTLSLPNAGMAVIIDVGDAKDIHPRDKQTVGYRLAQVALARDYGKKIEYSGPMYKSMKVEGGAIRLSFDHIRGGLVAKGGELVGFAIAGADKKFVWAKAKIDGNTVVVSSDSVAQPAAVRYAWADNPKCTLYNKEGLPASPFRTDEWPGVTAQNK
jgi:sialate O-acetylesterase